MLQTFHELNSAFPWLIPCFLFVFGTIIGSFLNVCILRVPRGESIVSPRSHCACGAPIAWYDNIPILSWILLRGRARCCGRPFSIRYPAIEALTGLLFTACWLLLPPSQAVCGLVFVSCLVCATFIDLDHMVIPNGLTLGLAVSGVLLSILFPQLHGDASGIYIIDAFRSAMSSVLGVLIGSGLVLWIALAAEAVLKKEAMGFGDVKFVGAMGAFIGWQGTVTAIFGGALIGTVWFALAFPLSKLLHKSPEKLLKAESAEGQPTELCFGAQVPYGPMLAIAGAVHFLFLHAYVNAYFHHLAVLFSSTGS